MDLDDDDDEVIAEYPLYAVSITDLNSQAADIRLAQLQYPLRPEWRGYGIENATEVTYKPAHRILTATVPEDELSKVRGAALSEQQARKRLPQPPAGSRPCANNALTRTSSHSAVRRVRIWPSKSYRRALERCPAVQKQGARVHLSGRGRVPEAPLCALCKVDGAFVLMAIDELTSLRPDMSKVVQDEAARKAAEEGKAADGEWKSRKKDGGVAGARKNGDDAGASDGKATLSTVKVRGVWHRGSNAVASGFSLCAIAYIPRGAAMQSQSWLLTLAQRAQQVLDHRHTAALPITFQHHSSSLLP